MQSKQSALKTYEILQNRVYKTCKIVGTYERTHISPTNCTKIDAQIVRSHEII